MLSHPIYQKAKKANISPKQTSPTSSALNSKPSNPQNSPSKLAEIPSPSPGQTDPPFPKSNPSPISTKPTVSIPQSTINTTSPSGYFQTVPPRSPGTPGPKIAADSIQKSTIPNPRRTPFSFKTIPIPGSELPDSTARKSINVPSKSSNNKNSRN